MRFLRYAGAALCVLFAANLHAQSSDPRVDSLWAKLTPLFRRVDTVTKHDTITVRDTIITVRVDTTVRTDTLVRTDVFVHTDTLRRVDTVFVAAPKPAPTPVPTPVPPVVSLDTASRTLYERNALTYASKLWVQDGPNWAGNYYDRSHFYSVIRGLPAFGFDSSTAQFRADTIEVDYRVKYLEASANSNGKCNPIANWVLPHGIFDHWTKSRLTGDTANASADYAMLQCLADNLRSFIPSTYFVGQSNGDTRIAARTLDALRYARRSAAIVGDTALVARRRTDETRAIDRLVIWQHADGSWPQAQTCNGDLNYMDGMLSSSLAETQRDHYDVRADTLIVRTVRFLKTQWRADSSFNYASVTCPNGGMTTAPDLNMDFTRPFLEAYRLTGDSSFLAIADAAFAVGTRKAYLVGSKQFNESYNPDALIFYLMRPQVH